MVRAQRERTMGQYLDQIDAAPPAERWPLVRRLMMQGRQPFFAELRAERPVLELPELTFLTRHHDCIQMLARWRDFGVDLYKPKQGDYFMAQDDSADHWRDKSVMKAILDVERIPAMRAFVGEKAREILNRSHGRIDAPQALTRAVPIALVQDFFGFTRSDPAKLQAWSYWNQQDAFHNQPFDADVVDDAEHIIAERKKANIMLAFYVGRLVLRRSVQVKLGQDIDDSVARLLRLSFSEGIQFPLKKVLFNAGGLLIGAVETTSHAVTNALAELIGRPDILARAQRAAADPAEFDGYVFEALRFNPAFPYFFRTCHRATQFAGGTPHARTVEPGTTVIACTHSAMFDEGAYAEPETFDPRRSADETFTFGYGHHECLGRHVATAMVPEIVRQVLLRQNLRADAPVEFRAGVPERYVLRWDV
jgi:cytochrome P450